MAGFEMGTRKGDRGIFDLLLGWADNLRNLGLYPFGLEELISTIERMIDDIGDEIVEKAVTRKLRFWYELLNNEEPVVEGSNTSDPLAHAEPNVEEPGHNREEVINAFRINSLLLIEVLSGWEGPDSTDSTLESLKLLGAEPPVDWKPSVSSTFASTFAGGFMEMFIVAAASAVSVNGEAIVEAMAGRGINADTAAQIVISCASALSIAQNIYTSFPRRTDPSGRQSNAERERLKRDAKHLWTIEIRFPSKSINCSNAGYALWAVAAGLEQIRGVVVEIDSWGQGSLWTKLKVFISNIWARDEVQEVLDKSRDAVVAEYLDKRIETAKKLKSEREKIEKERDAIAKQSDALPNAEEAEITRDQQRKLKDLEIREKETDIVRKELENRIRSLEFVEKASSLIAKGVIAADPVRIDINGIMFLLTDSNEVRQGPDIKTIREAENVPMDNDDKPDIEAL